MQELLDVLDRWRREGEAVALATLVRVRGTAPRLPGARMGVTRSGKMVGSVSGGCVENDIVERALLVLDAAAPALASYGIADDSGLEVGLSCATLEVLIEPFDAPPVWEIVRRAIETHVPAALAIGLAPAGLLGRALVVSQDGTRIGSVDPDVDTLVASEVSRLLEEGGTRVITLPYRGEESSVYVETFSPPLRLFIVGGTHTAVALCRMAKYIGFHVTVIDARSAYVSRERFPEADALVHAHPGEALKAAGLEGSYVVTLTHDLRFDLPTLALGLRSGTRYVGAMGSRRTHEQRKAELRRQGFTERELERIHTPIGLDIGSRTPEEIALAILAEILAVRSGRDAQPLARVER